MLPVSFIPVLKLLQHFLGFFIKQKTEISAPIALKASKQLKTPIPKKSSSSKTLTVEKRLADYKQKLLNLIKVKEFSKDFLTFIQTLENPDV